MIIEIKGVEFENKGAELMLHSVLDRVKLYWPDAQIALSPSPKAPYLKRAKLASWQKISIRKLYFDLNELTYYLPTGLRNWFKKWGIVTEADIDMVIDASGFSYSDQWDPAMSIRHLSAEINRNSKHKKPYIFMPQALGPFSSPGVRNNIRSSFKNAALICAREQDSYQHVHSITGDLSQLQIFGDFTNAQKGKVPNYYVDGVNKACIVPNKNMVNPRNKNKSWLGTYKNMLINAIEIYREQGLTPFFLNHEGKEDAHLIDEINRSIAKPLEVINEDDPIAVKGIIANSKAVLCSRFHGCVSALSNSIACLGTSWSHKYERLYEEYNCSQLLLSPEITRKQLEETILTSLDKENDLHQVITENAALYKEQTENLWQSVISASEKYRQLS